MKKLFLSIVLLLSTLFSFAFAEQKAVLYFSGAGKDYSVGQYININVIADPKGQSLDTVRIVVNFSKDTLQVQSVALGSIFSVADPDNFYSNADGAISYTAGALGGTNKLSNFATISFMVKKAGELSISFDGQSVVLSGGENILSGVGQPIKLSIKETALKAPEESQTTISSSIPQNTQTEPLAAKKEPQKTEQQKTGPAALEAAAIPIAQQSLKVGFLEKLNSKKWPFLLMLLALFLVFFYRRKNISAFLKRIVSKKDGINGTTI